MQGHIIKRLFTVKITRVKWQDSDSCEEQSEEEVTLMLGITAATRTLNQALDKKFLAEKMDDSSWAASRIVETPRQLVLYWKRSQVYLC